MDTGPSHSKSLASRRNGTASNSFPSAATLLCETVSGGIVYPFSDKRRSVDDSLGKKCSETEPPPKNTVGEVKSANAAKHGTLTTAPLGICINIPLTADKPVNPDQEIVKALLTEIRLYAEKYDRRPVTQLMWRNPYQITGGPEVTEILHYLSSRFCLNPATPHEYCAEIDLLTITEDQLALLRGLGFNQILLRLDAPMASSSREDTREKLRRRTQRLRDYRFVNIGVKLSYGHSAYGLYHQRQLLDTVIALQPDRIILGEISEDCLWDTDNTPLLPPATDTHSQFALLYHSLQNAGYRVIGNDCFVKPHDGLAVAQSKHRLRHTVLNYNTSNASDLLGLGPGACSQLGRSYSHNASDFGDYALALQQELLPVHKSFTLSHTQHLVRLVIDQALCYHSIDVPYLESRYNTPLSPFLNNALGTLKCPCNEPLLHYDSDNRINLTSTGIFNLRAICDALISATLKREI